MVRRFRYLTEYPDKFNPAKTGENQSAVPSQHSPVALPFDPSRNPDMQFRLSQTDPDVSIVRASFDSRPPYAYDFFFEDFFIAGIPFNGVGTAGYNVPVGFNLILREIVLSLYPATGAAQIISPFGDYDVADGPVPPVLQILINGVQAPTFTVGVVKLYDLFFSDVQVPCFIPVPGGSTVKVNLPGYATDDGVAHGFNTYVHYYGNVLVDTGRNLVNEVGNAKPLPVVDASNA